MSSQLDLEEAIAELAELWEEQAKGLERFDEDDRAAKTLRMCAGEARKTVKKHAPMWVSSHQIRQRTGWSDVYLRKLYKELEAVGDARKRGSRWEVRLEAAKRIAVKRRTPSLAGLSIEEMGEVLGRAPETG